MLLAPCSPHSRASSFQPELRDGSQFCAVQPHLALSAATSWVQVPLICCHSGRPQCCGAPQVAVCRHVLGIHFFIRSVRHRKTTHEGRGLHAQVPRNRVTWEGPGWVRRQKERADHAWSCCSGFHRKERERQARSAELV